MFSDNNGNGQQQRRSKYSSFELIALYFLHFLALPPELLLRRKFGKRHLRLFHVSFTSVSIYILWIVTLTLAPVLLGQKDTILTFFYLLSVSLMATVHAVEIALRRKKGVVIHSYYTGWPRLMDYMPESVKTKCREWDIDLQIFIKMYVEPAICIGVGILAASIEPLLAMLIILGGIGMYIWGQYLSAIHDDNETDILDAQIEAGQLQKSLSQSNEEFCNFGLESYAPKPAKVVWPAKSKAPAPEDKDDETPKLDPELEKILYSDEEDKKESTHHHSGVKVDSPASRHKVVAAPITRGRGRPRKESAIYP